MGPPWQGLVQQGLGIGDRRILCLISAMKNLLANIR